MRVVWQGLVERQTGMVEWKVKSVKARLEKNGSIRKGTEQIGIGNNGDGSTSKGAKGTEEEQGGKHVI